MVQYGCSALARNDPIGVPILRMNNLQDEGLDLSDLKYIELGEDALESYRLIPGDLLFNRTNSKELVGKCEVFEEQGDWVFASYLIRIRAKEDLVIPRFIADFLATNSGRLQIDRLSRQIIGMTNINAEELRQILLPLPPPHNQVQLVAAMNAARAARKAKLAEAEALLSGMDDFLLKILDIVPPAKDNRRVFAVQLSISKTQGRLNSDYYHPERILALRTLEDASTKMPCAALSEIVTFERDAIKTPSGTYLSLAHVQSHTGELVDANEEASGGCVVFQKDDVLFARLRPYLNKVYRAEIEGCCSPEFHVLRIKKGVNLIPDYLAAILRSRLVLAQTTHMMTGNTHPRLTNNDVVNLVIPIPEQNIQRSIAAEVRRRRDEARRLRLDAEREWADAKARFEAALLGNEVQAITSA